MIRFVCLVLAVCAMVLGSYGYAQCVNGGCSVSSGYYSTPVQYSDYYLTSTVQGGSTGAVSGGSTGMYTTSGGSTGSVSAGSTGAVSSSTAAGFRTPLRTWLKNRTPILPWRR
jgi:hypothetical protein